jgi:hypothetical protein
VIDTVLSYGRIKSAPTLPEFELEFLQTREG